jgi:hypothetical protein
MPPAVVKRLDLPEVSSVPKRSKALGASFSRLPPVRPKTAAIVRWVAEGEQRANAGEHSWDLIIPLPVGLSGDSQPIIDDSRGSRSRRVIID